ncbi:EamA family transporter [Micromonospora sp. DSM 115977]|uniref:EamA family transporter n=1 Tax=Micromonospora reichwaldensis TaxID=3075516 RepID=A0ABU2WW13_9ACTN|nr:EamA family transporter [Micromonospora sp. DSM 115977]MDT0530116.1 EamA family transporter [Micromonospora sp. DSM 115977]
MYALSSRPLPAGRPATRLSVALGQPRAVPPPLLMLLGMLSTQVGAAVAKQLFGSTSAGGTTTLRLGFAALILLVLVRPGLRLGWRTAGLVGAFGLALAVMNLAFYAALHRVPLGVAVTIGFAGPLLVSLAGSRRLADVAWAALAGGGVLLISGLGGTGVDRLGLLCCVAVAVGWAGYVLLGKAVSARVPGSRGLALGMAVAALAVLPFGVAGSGTALLDPWTLALGAAVALLSSVLPYSAEMAALRRMPARVFAVLLSLEPAIGALVGLVLLGELLAWPQAAGVACVVGAALGATLVRPDRSSAPH